jgi:hypothetical protein
MNCTRLVLWISSHICIYQKNILDITKMLQCLILKACIQHVYSHVYEYNEILICDTVISVIIANSHCMAWMWFLSLISVYCMQCIVVFCLSLCSFSFHHCIGWFFFPFTASNYPFDIFNLTYTNITRYWYVILSETENTNYFETVYDQNHYHIPQILNKRLKISKG